MNRLSSRVVNLRPCFAFALALSLSVGCGTAEYQSRMADTIEMLELKGKFADLEDRAQSVVYDPERKLSITVSLQRPKSFAGLALNQTSRDPNNSNAPIPDNRLKPPFLLAFPGFQMTFEQMSRTVRGMRPYSFYIGVQPTDPEAATKIEAEIKQALPQATDLSWRTEDVLKPDGTKVLWKVLTFIGDQLFHTPGFPNPDLVPGTFGLMMYETNGHQIFLGYRIATSAEEAEKLPAAVKQAAGTVEVAKAAPGLKF